MALEVADTILDLNENWPLGTDPLAQGDDHIRLLKTVLQAAYPIGSVLYNTTGTNPGTYIGGTWTATSQGRAIVGVGNNGTSEWTAGQERGFEAIALTDAQMPVHEHLINEITDGVAESDGAHTHSYEDKGELVGGGVIANTSGFALGDTTRTTASDGAHTHSVTISARDTASAGSGDPHNNIQPSLAFYVWERTA